MAGKNIVTINGRSYDAITGLPVASSAAPSVTPKKDHANLGASQHHKHRAFSDISGPAKTAILKPAEVRAHAIHKQPQKSQTLLRAALKKPIPMRQLQPAPVKVEADYAKKKSSSIHKPEHDGSHPKITRFGPGFDQSNAIPARKDPAMQATSDIEKPARMHPIVAKALAKQPAAPVAPQSSKELKEALIRERLAEAQPNTEQPKKTRRFSSQPKFVTIMTSSLALLLIAGYLTYLNLPNISMRVAAVRAGISANYPNYNPDGYHFAGPITFQPGEVNIAFKSNTNTDHFTINQKASSWDSRAVLDNYVSKKTDNYLTYQERGLTIYSYGNHAAWVNGGLLYTIDGNAPLSSDQLLRIATSM